MQVTQTKERARLGQTACVVVVVVEVVVVVVVVEVVKLWSCGVVEWWRWYGRFDGVQKSWILQQMTAANFPSPAQCLI